MLDEETKINIVEPEKAVLSCPEHGEYEGYIMRLKLGSVDAVCPECMKLEIEEERKDLYKRIEVNKNRDTFNQSAIPPRYQKRQFEDYKAVSQESDDIKTLMMRYSDRFGVVLDHGTSFFFIGGPGTGKTHIACSVAMSIVNNGYTAKYTTLLDIISKVKTCWVKGSDLSEDDIISEYTKPDLLIIDEVGLGNLGQKDKEMAFRVINRRYEGERPLITISNYDLNQANKALGVPTVSRMTSGGGKVLVFNWGDYRQSVDKF